MAEIAKRKLIEVALPLEAINREASREKARKVGKPQQIHHWWARRPITAARAVLFAQLVDDPSASPEEFPTEDLQRTERDRLHKLVAQLARWDAISDRDLLKAAHYEIVKSTGNAPPVILDPFAGGGTIPLEAQRLGLSAQASDLNPVAVLINKALVELPTKFLDCPPVFPGLAGSQIRTWAGSAGLAADVREYGSWMRQEAFRRVGHVYQPVVLPDGSTTTPIAWIWARTVACPNPACRIEMPLVRSWMLATKKGKEAHVAPKVVDDPLHSSGHRVSYSVKTGPAPGLEGTGSARAGARCVSCDSVASVEYLRTEGREGRIGQALIAVVAEGTRGRIYLSPDSKDLDPFENASIPAGLDAPLDYDPRAITAPNYGMTRFADLYTSRQLLVISTLNDMVAEVRDKVIEDCGNTERANAIATYVALAISRLADWSNSLCRWEKKGEVSQQLFGQQTISMVWDFSEAWALGPKASGSLGACLNVVCRSIEQLTGPTTAEAFQLNAIDRFPAAGALNTDPPYYDNVPYAALSDFFYVWLRRSLREIYPQLLSTMLVPKADELVANPFRQKGRDGARKFFEHGFREVFARAREGLSGDFPAIVYYAFKQSESDMVGEVSTGWEALLEAMIRSGWQVTATWPIRSEADTRRRSLGSNALASSIVISLRPRPPEADSTDRRGFIASLNAELPTALRRLQQGQIAPVDLPQAAIGPGVAVFSRYAKVIEADGSPMTVRSALARINEILDQVLNEQEGDFDSVSRFAIAWYRQHGYGTGTFGDADNLARARDTAVDLMERHGVLTSRAGKVTLHRPADLPADYDVLADRLTSNWEALHHLIRILDSGGVSAAGGFLATATSRQDGAVDADLVKELAFLLFSVAEKNGWTMDALSFNTLATSWAEIAEATRAPRSAQGTLEFEEE